MSRWHLANGWARRRCGPCSPGYWSLSNSRLTMTVSIVH